MWCNWNCEKGRDLYVISPCGCVSHSPVERRKTTHSNCLCLRESVCIFSSSYFFGTYSILNWYMQSTHSHTHPSHSQTLSFWILNFFHHLVVCLVSFFTQLVRTAPDWTINRPQVLRFSNEKKAKNQIDKICAALSHKNICLCSMGILFSFLPPPSRFRFRSLTMRYRWDCDFHLQYQKKEWFHNKWRMSREDSNSHKQQTTNENPKQIDQCYLSIHTSADCGGRKAKIPNQISCSQFFELLLWNHNFSQNIFISK